MYTCSKVIIFIHVYIVPVTSCIDVHEIIANSSKFLFSTFTVAVTVDPAYPLISDPVKPTFTAVDACGKCQVLLHVLSSLPIMLTRIVRALGSIRAEYVDMEDK